jgi:hypothetical protein
MSFRCQVTGRVQPIGTKPTFVVVGKRNRSYYNTPDGRPRIGNSDNADLEAMREVGSGWEITKELMVCPDGLEQLRSKGLIV